MVTAKSELNLLI